MGPNCVGKNVQATKEDHSSRSNPSLEMTSSRSKGRPVPRWSSLWISPHPKLKHGQSVKIRLVASVCLCDRQAQCSQPRIRPYLGIAPGLSHQGVDCRECTFRLQGPARLFQHLVQSSSPDRRADILVQTDHHISVETPHSKAFPCLQPLPTHRRDRSLSADERFALQGCVVNRQDPPTRHEGCDGSPRVGLHLRHPTRLLVSCRYL